VCTAVTTIRETSVSWPLVRCVLVMLAGLMIIAPGMAELSSSAPSQRSAEAGLYLGESFDGGSVPGGWTVQLVVGTNATWTVVGMGTNPTVVPHSGSGQAMFNSYDANLGEQARLVSPVLDLSSSTDPFAEFFMYHDAEFAASADSLILELSTADSVQGPWVPLLNVARPRPTPGWVKEAVSLSGAKGQSRVFLAFRGLSGYGNNIFLDDVRVLDSTFHDIRAVGFVGSINVPTVGAHGHQQQKSATRHDVAKSGSFAVPVRMESVYSEQQDLALGVVVENVGTFPESTYSVLWGVDGQMQPPVGNDRSLGRGEQDTLLLPWSAPSPGWHEVAAWTFLSADSNQANDTARVGVQILDSSVVSYELFNGELFPPPGWSVANRDGGPENAWFRGSMVSAFVPFEGAGFAADNFQRANGSYLDDYLISSPVPNMGAAGARDSLIFWVRSVYAEPPAVNYPDSLMILLSLGGSDTSDFSVSLDYFEVPKGIWSRRAYGLTGVVPQNSTVRAAFRYLHYDAGTSGANADFVGIDAVQFTHIIVTALSDAPLPEVFALSQNFPNPFNPVTVVRYQLPVGSSVKVEVYDLLGCEVATLVNGWQSAGVHDVAWNGRNSAGVELSSGVYFYRLDAGAYSSTRKMILMR
jgi:hypothetical protein